MHLFVLRVSSLLVKSASLGFICLFLLLATTFLIVFKVFDTDLICLLITNRQGIAYVRLIILGKLFLDNKLKK